MPFTDKQIYEWAKNGGVDPFIPEAINPASIDLHLGRYFYDFYSKNRTMHQLSYVQLYPNTVGVQLWNMLFRKKKLTIILTMTFEKISIPDNVAASIRLKTTPTRKGLGQVIGDWVDPGFTGNLTLMLRAHKALNLRYCQPICQLVLEKLDEPVAKSYSETGHYNRLALPTFAYDEA